MSNPKRGMMRPLRLATGLVLFIYATSHLLNHAFGIRSAGTMEAAANFLLDPWQTMPGLVLLYGAVAIHVALGLYSLYRRRHFRMPASEAMQIALGLSIPLLLISHAAAIRIGEGVYDLSVGYDRVLYLYWVATPDFGLPRQYLLLAIVWIHGCLGIRAWLRSKRWYARAVPALAALATLVPVLAALGFLNAGLDMRYVAANAPASLGKHVADRPGTRQASDWAQVSRIVDGILVGYRGLVAGVFTLRAGRNWHARRYGSIRVAYPDGRMVSVPAGFSVLEASRWAGVPHASVCGGRGRCSTCRVGVLAGAEYLSPPSGDELRLLTRIGAPPDVRLACQIRPTGNVAVVPLVNPASDPVLASRRFGAIGSGREMEIAALFVDMRQSTRLADDRLPYDVLFLFDRYIQMVSTAVRESGGHVTNIAGDGIMSVFGVDGTAEKAARDAFSAALRVWDGIDALNAELRAELPEPFRIGMGLHVGVAVVGAGWKGGTDGLPFLGDTGNVAARLEAEAKRLDCTLVASAEALSLLDNSMEGAALDTVMIRGKFEPVRVARFAVSDELRKLLARRTAKKVA
ncbi:adenylate/guanylate cyclase domain-containing protein [Allomesorhizobium camelthorni]|uniref:2Fe-2S iron-sulfur cluster binding domain-containing protein n=1 Tax=Allomesorhizobium camelthorni TaxID=475069 RepID=A0A6G4WA25_9HYPH|nr:2Fe-2S iron-sulfur cluster binding domain-containing protein [Mesorhizobium camelthorni]